ncbi:MAG: mannose-1-phosphate guanylyltransferase [Bacteroidales bacterium]|nr:mannose-1-phosphate guanylyltransferase [Bacteroidales bacterium]MBO7346761.1 mannose-1-phosphate guanylyltransferase [Bacteroidales bacterium]MBQ4477683.1 mannose-1-phosphate guanylyltransferase [Bacteroidales bacterium]MBR4453914.1 mannose-1-phosphate guanylyltransferase [Bacteroidales bacterium]MCR5554501.1 mannose-1-phosphate guanylyltransferase [Bacteroidales bacterium]
MSNNYCVIMAGGVGARFWPLSRTSRPKQFIDILGVGKSLIQLTIDRFVNICPIENIYIVTNEIYYNLVKEQLPQLSDEQIILEPMRRNTAPCIAYANEKIKKRCPDANIIVAPSDHVIINETSFVEHIKAALDCAEHNPWLLTLGIKPVRPDTGYGYIQYDEKQTYAPERRISKVKIFTEKPQLELAKQFLESGDFLWNAGIFVWKLSTIEAAFKQYLPEVYELFEACSYKIGTEGEKEAINQTYQRCPSISVDYGIMEKAVNVHVLASDFGWSDLGTWGSLYEQLKHDTNNNAIQAPYDVFTYDTKDCIISTPKNKVVVIQGLKDYIVSESDNTLLICRKEDEQQIRQFVNDVQLQKGDKYI